MYKFLIWQLVDPAEKEDKREADVQTMKLTVAAAHLPKSLTN